MDFGSFLKRREMERAQVQDPFGMPGPGPPAHGYDGPSVPSEGEYYQNSFQDPSYHDEQYYNSGHGQGADWFSEGQVSTNMDIHGNGQMQRGPGFGYERPFRGHPSKIPGRGAGRGRNSGRGILKNKSHGRGGYQDGYSQDQTYEDSGITQAYKTSNYQSDDPGYGYEEAYQSYEDYTKDDTSSNFAKDTMFSTQYGFGEKNETYIDSVDAGPAQDTYIDNVDAGPAQEKNQENEKRPEHKEKEENTAQEQGEENDSGKGPNESQASEGEAQEKTADSEKKTETEKKVDEENSGEKNEDDDDDDEDEDDEASKAIKKLPPSHSRGLMSTLIGMLGTDALNRKPDPLPAPKPAKLKPKDDFNAYLKQTSQNEENDDDENETFDVMELPAEERDLNPDDFDSGPNSDLFCKICHVQTTSLGNLQAHLDGKSHRSKLNSISQGKIINVTKNPKKKMVISPFELGKKSFVLEALESNQSEPIIGLSFITEYQSVSQIMCVCNLCGVKFDHNAALSHTSGAKHRFQYMKEKRPSEYVHLKRFGGRRTQLASFLQELSVDVEKQDGRGQPVLKVFDVNEKPSDAKVAPESIEKERTQSDKEGSFGARKEERHSKEKDYGGNQDDRERGFYNWVEAECTKSREAREQRRSPSPPPPRHERYDDNRAPPYGRGGDGPRRPGFDRRMDRYSPGPPRFPEERGTFRGPYTGPRPPIHSRDYMDSHRRYPYDDDLHLFQGRRPFPPHPPRDRHFDESFMGHRNLPPEGPPVRPVPPIPKGYPPREVTQPAPYLDPDPVRRLEMLKKARQEAASSQRVPPRAEPYLDPDPLKRVLKRDAVQKPVVIDYSHGTAMNDRRPAPSLKRKDKWEDDIKSILGNDKDKKLNNLASLSNTYSSPERLPPRSSPKPIEKTKVDKPLPFSKSYLDIPENKKRLKDLRKKAESPPIPGIDRRPLALDRTRKRRSSSSSSSLSSVSSPSPKRQSNKDLKPRHLSSRFSPLSRRGRHDSQEKRRRSRSRSPVRRSSSRSPERPGMRYSSGRKETPYDMKRDQREPYLDRRRGGSPLDKKVPEGESQDRLSVKGSAKNPILIFNDDKKQAQGKSPLVAASGSKTKEHFGYAPFPDERGVQKRFEPGRFSLLSDGSRGREDHGNLNVKLPSRRSKDPTSQERERQSQFSPPRKKDRLSQERHRPPKWPPSPKTDHRSPDRGRPTQLTHLQNRDWKYQDGGKPSQVSPPQSRDRRSHEQQRPSPLSPPREKEIRYKDRESYQQIHQPDKKSSDPDDSEDAQAERIADMLLSMSGVLSSSGDDAQATLQALLSNPEMAETILQAQAGMSKKPSRDERSPPAGRNESGYERSPPSTSHSSRVQNERSPPSTSHSSRVQSERSPPPTSHSSRVQRASPVRSMSSTSSTMKPRERVAFSFGRGRNSLQQSAAFAASSSDEDAG
ncbi:hypothetical protein ElyMa_006932800 [Elysia marginata]|uniref:U1-type domain-containing protein n=1 Tax=Elysia marginata TaxID=1093978 RepID=A0AAV4JMG7_9GAST|nr:hypothetical protein ElyMa_006932800 [Elysia marginata]